MEKPAEGNAIMTPHEEALEMFSKSINQKPTTVETRSRQKLNAKGTEQALAKPSEIKREQGKIQQN